MHLPQYTAELDRYLEFFPFGVRGRCAKRARGGEICHAVSGFNVLMELFFFVIMFVEHQSVE